MVFRILGGLTEGGKGIRQLKSVQVTSREVGSQGMNLKTGNSKEGLD